MLYDYRKGRDRVEEILKTDLNIINEIYLPNVDKLTFGKAYYSKIAGIFIDIRNSSSLIKNNDNKNIAKILKAFTSELIEILRMVSV